MASMALRFAAAAAAQDTLCAAAALADAKAPQLAFHTARSSASTEASWSASPLALVAEPARPKPCCQARKSAPLTLPSALKSALGGTDAGAWARHAARSEAPTA